ncbi:MAG: hypothetical protein SF069_19195 [Phycisphaerae bacterium]|nr:hypothetical protein [Phycisphaerae bacterium]
MHAESLKIERSSSKPFSSVDDAAAHPLYAAIRRYEFDEPGTSFTFEARLARENGWTRGYARRVIEEYRRFVFLAMVSKHPVTPSEQVDQAWHLHLTFTRKYWEELCGRVLPRPLHHNPTRGGAAEGAKFVDWYERTRGLYRAWFGAEPPADIWPASATRFGHDLRWSRVNTQDHWIIRKPSRRAIATAAGFATVGLAAMGAGGAALAAAQPAGGSTAGDSMPISIAIATGLVCLGLLVTFVIVLTASSRARRRRDESAGAGVPDTGRAMAGMGARREPTPATAAPSQRSNAATSDTGDDYEFPGSRRWSPFALFGWGAAQATAPIDPQNADASRKKKEEGGCGGAGCGGGGDVSIWTATSGGPASVSPGPAASQPTSQPTNHSVDADSGGDAGGGDAGGGGDGGGCGGGGCGGGGCGGCGG